MAAPGQVSTVEQVMPSYELSEKRIHKGDSEISPDLALGYSSFSGVILETDLAYRYFFFDKVALGAIVGLNTSDSYREYSLGATGRWYFYETKNWAFSFTQNIVANYIDSRFGTGSNTYRSIVGESSFGAHYFFTPNVSLIFSGNYEYGISNSPSPTPKFTTRVGLGFSF